MAKKRKKRRRTGLIAKDWTVKDGVVALPAKVREQIASVFDSLELGFDVRSVTFFRKITEGQRTYVARELSLAGVCPADIAMLFGITINGVYRILERAKEEALTVLGPTWMAANIVSKHTDLEGDAAWFRAKSIGAIDESLALEARRGAVNATDKAGNLLLKAEEIAKILGKKAGEGENNPSDRVDFLQQVFEQKILPQLEAPKPEAQEAEVV